LRRQGKVNSALKCFVEGVEAANKTNSRAALSYLWLERGHSEELAKVGGSGGGGWGTVVSPEDGGKEDCVRSFNMSVDIANEAGSHAIAAKARKKLRDYGIERASLEDGGRGLSRSECAQLSGLSRSQSDLHSGSSECSFGRGVSRNVSNASSTGGERIRRESSRKQSFINTELSALLLKEGEGGGRVKRQSKGGRKGSITFDAIE